MRDEDTKGRTTFACAIPKALPDLRRVNIVALDTETTTTACERAVVRLAVPRRLSLRHHGGLSRRR